jgi:hypothetical protein
MYSGNLTDICRVISLKSAGSQVPFCHATLPITFQKSVFLVQCPVYTDVCKYNIQFVNGKSNYMCN